MDTGFKEKFITLWNTYFPGAELPLALYYSDQPDPGSVRPDPKEHRCLLSSIQMAREGEVLTIGKENIGCLGGKRYSGFTQNMRSGFEYFLSYGNEKIEGERYKKNPELVNDLLADAQPYNAPWKFLIVKRWDLLTEDEQPLLVVFFATPDILSGMYTLANYDESTRFGVIAPMGAGCATLIQFPLQEAENEHPKCVLGMFDPSARPNISSNELSFTVPIERFKTMVGNMEESFLITPTWEAIQQRIQF